MLHCVVFLFVADYSDHSFNLPSANAVFHFFRRNISRVCARQAERRVGFGRHSLRGVAEHHLCVRNHVDCFITAEAGAKCGVSSDSHVTQGYGSRGVVIKHFSPFLSIYY